MTATFGRTAPSNERQVLPPCAASKPHPHHMNFRYMRWQCGPKNSSKSTKERGATLQEQCHLFSPNNHHESSPCPLSLNLSFYSGVRCSALHIQNIHWKRSCEVWLCDSFFWALNRPQASLREMENIRSKRASQQKEKPLSTSTSSRPSAVLWPLLLCARPSATESAGAEPGISCLLDMIW